METDKETTKSRAWYKILTTYYDMLKESHPNQYVVNSMADWLDSEFLKDERNDPIIRDLGETTEPSRSVSRIYSDEELMPYVKNGIPFGDPKHAIGRWKAENVPKEELLSTQVEKLRKRLEQSNKVEKLRKRLEQSNTLNKINQETDCSKNISITCEIRSNEFVEGEISWRDSGIPLTKDEYDKHILSILDPPQ